MDDFEFEDIVDKKSWKKPLLIILALFILFMFVVSVFPWWNMNVNPPPDLGAVDDFELTEYEMNLLTGLAYAHTASVSDAISQVNVADYRIITNRLVTDSCSTHSDLCYVKAIYYYVQSLQYVSDPDYQYVQSPAETLTSGGGDCEDFALLTTVMAESIGVDADIGVTSNHAFVRTQVANSAWSDSKSYVWIDPTSDSDFGVIGFANDDVLGWYEVA